VVLKLTPLNIMKRLSIFLYLFCSSLERWGLDSFRFKCVLELIEVVGNLRIVTLIGILSESFFFSSKIMSI
jgi:hypothetical protein